MLKDIIRVRPRDGYRLEIEFEDGLSGVMDLGDVITFTGIFEPLKSRNYFVQVHVNRETGTIEWPNGADLDPDVLYALVSGEPIPSFNQTNVPATG
jgi:hypothetical protein